MRLDHRFTVPAPIDEAWRVLLDLPRIAPCMPGATLTEFDGEQFTGTVKVKLGPVSLTYKGTGRLTEVDESAHRAVISASGKESRGSGTAAATITATLVDDGGGTTGVNVVTDLTVTGRPAQFGRGMLADVGDRLLGQFAECLATKLGGAEDEGSAAGEPTGEPSVTGAAATDVPAGSGTTATTGAATSRDRPAPDDEVEAIDLLEVTGADAMLRKYAPAIAGAAVAITLLVFLIRAIAGRRGRRS